MTNQEFYDKTVRHLVDQQVQAWKEGDGCVYRLDHAPDKPLMCAAGCHIPDHLYRPDMEGNNITNVVKDEPKLKPFFPDLDLAQQLQMVHDKDSSWKQRGQMGLSDKGVELLRLVERHFSLQPFDFGAVSEA